MSSPSDAVHSEPENPSSSSSSSPSRKRAQDEISKSPIIESQSPPAAEEDLELTLPPSSPSSASPSPLSPSSSDNEPRRKHSFPNLRFYMNEIESRPDGDLIDTIHRDWFGNYDLLELHHGYIQWLFPLMEGGGMNYKSVALKEEELEEMKSKPEIIARLKKSYALMLDFYGMEVVDSESGVLQRNGKNWKDRFRNLEKRTHNYLRVTRIMKCLRDFGLVDYQRNLLKFFVDQITCQGQLQGCIRSLVDFWITTIEDEEDEHRLELEKKVEEYKQEKKRQQREAAAAASSSNDKGQSKLFSFCRK